MTDDRQWSKNWNKDFDASNEERKKLRTEEDKRMIKKYATKIDVNTNKKGQEKWFITFQTKFGLNHCNWYLDTGKWTKAKGKAKGKGAKSMLNYFQPILDNHGNC